jgi:hypothetical protein
VTRSDYQTVARECQVSVATIYRRLAEIKPRRNGSSDALIVMELAEAAGALERARRHAEQANRRLTT